MATRRYRLAVAVGSVLAACSVADAQSRSIGVNFSGGAGSEAPDPNVDNVAAGQVTGVVPQANWNNAQGASGTVANLVNDTGAASGASLTYASNNTWGRDLSDTPNNNLLSDYLDGGTGVPVTVTVANVPYPAYDVYIYTRRNETADPADPTPADGPGRFSDYTLNGVTQNVLTGDIRDNFLQATDTVIGNYTVFRGVTGSTLSLTANTNAGNFRAPVDGLQIVEVPEPASLGVLGGGAVLGGLGLLGRRRRKA